MCMHLFEARTTTKLSRQLSETSPMTEPRCQTQRYQTGSHEHNPTTTSDGLRDDSEETAATGHANANGDWFVAGEGGELGGAGRRWTWGSSCGGLFEQLTEGVFGRCSSGGYCLMGGCLGVAGVRGMAGTGGGVWTMVVWSRWKVTWWCSCSGEEATAAAA